MRRNGLRIQHAQRRFQHGPNRDRRCQDIGKALYLVRAIHFWQQYRVWVTVVQRGNIVLPPRGIQAVDPHDLNPRAIATLAQRRGQGLARCRLGLRRDRVLQI